MLLLSLWQEIWGLGSILTRISRNRSTKLANLGFSTYTTFDASESICHRNLHALWSMLLLWVVLITATAFFLVYPLFILLKLQRLQNAAARLISNVPRYSHITPVLCSLHWLPVKFRIDFKILLLTFKAIYGHAPGYLTDLIAIKVQTRYTLRSASGLTLNYPSVKLKKTLGDRAFSSAAPTLWNSLPLHIRLVDNFERFKSVLLKDASF